MAQDAHRPSIHPVAGAHSLEKAMSRIIPTITDIDKIDGKVVAYHSDLPKITYEVTNLFDAYGDETDDIDIAIGGVIKIAEDCWVCFDMK